MSADAEWDHFWGDVMALYWGEKAAEYDARVKAKAAALAESQERCQRFTQQIRAQKGRAAD